MTVEPDGPHRTLHAGISYGFCGPRCLERFRDDPERFLAESPSDRSVEGPGPYTCPMHPEIVQDEFGTCPICGMALEPMEISAEEEANPELEDMLRRFKFGLVLTLPVFIVAMLEMVPGNPISSRFSAHALVWFQFLFARPWAFRPAVRSRKCVRRLRHLLRRDADLGSQHRRGRGRSDRDEARVRRRAV